MKKIFAMVLAFAMILSMGVVFASAATHPKPDKATAGAYAGGSASAFKPVGDIILQWVPDAADKIDLSDGEIDEWAEFKPVSITPDNVVSWVGNGEKATTKGEGDVDPDMPKDWDITAYFVADPTYLYIAFYVTDDNVVASETYRAGDHFQICIDFGGKLGEVIENDPDTAILMSNTQNIFYTFNYAGDGKPITIKRDCSDDDRNLTSEGPYDLSDESNPKDDVRGTTAKTDAGWSAEFALPWEMLYDDYALKGWKPEDSRIYIGGDENKPLESGIALYYCNINNVDGKDTGIIWAAGTTNGLLKEEGGAPAVSWDAYDNGINLILEADPKAGIKFTTDKIHVMIEGETEPEEVTTIETTKAPVATTEPAESDSESTSGTETAKTTTSGTAAAEEEGCASVLGMSAAIVLAAAAAVVLKKKD